MRTVKIAAASALMAAALYGCSKGQEAPAQGAPPVTVAAPLSQQVVDWDEFTGRFEAPRSVDVRARVGGYIQSVHFKDGDFVRQGQLLFTLDPRPAQAALASARAQLAQGQAQLTLARTELTRAEGLLASQAVSQAEVDAKRGAVQTAEAAVAAANAAIRARQLDVEFTRVTAPISGRVSDRRVDPGNLIGGGSSAGDVLTTIVSSSPIYFVFDGSEALALKYQRDARNGSAPIRIRLQDETSYDRTGTLDFTDNAIDASSGTIRLRAVVQNADGFLKPGMFGHAQLAGSGGYAAMLVPDSAVVTDGPRKVVYVVAKDGTVGAKPVQLGPLANGLRVVRTGLTPDDRVIINGLQRARPGQKVTAQNGTIKAEETKADAPVTTAPVASSATFVASAG
ncbi:Probable efflux pump periplasmic linker ttgA precursor [Brevundimonas diminuta]|jgi:RND family efflux transporter MFP subunit|uniref:Efflux RND transporter periplasmic adaptor subunit n=1 Tax=Brevundimonas diminuta TaxID=293 RepID=A0A246K7A9_BREDI|nr:MULTISPECIES: efflux RND transporter periplasmic adaptor subunit [Brevundimonas]ASD27116.1 MexE family multidrug efflux RND transporter periplasmic adaptor subunit [Brevundimonas diminuta]EGF96194.1 RND family efflux transporter MFP subunit [Brevundimonas diminuta ATCC 11568]MBD3572136.1 efflux RND transporter periplasmic adaptor subunit [Brevundimonas diminuta]MBD3819585.1 efflux RND transporter periplasmic adaptor subunit [Brevundimonas diminuta]MBI2250759.1 efflux RND transporter peripla